MAAKNTATIKFIAPSISSDDSDEEDPDRYNVIFLSYQGEVAW